MISVESSVEIARPVEEVFAFVADVANEPKWHTDTVRGRLDPPGPPGKGKVLHATFRAMGRTFDGVADVVEFEPARLIRYRFREATMGLKPTFVYRFEPSAQVTRFTRRLEAETSGAMALVAPLMRPLMTRRNSGFVANLKRELETSR